MQLCLLRCLRLLYCLLRLLGLQCLCLLTIRVKQYALRILETHFF